MDVNGHMTTFSLTHNLIQRSMGGVQLLDNNQFQVNYERAYRDPDHGNFLVQ